MLRRSLLTGAATALAAAIAGRSVRPQSDAATPAALQQIMSAILAATRYRLEQVELGVTKLQIVVTIVNSRLLDKRPIELEVEAGRITTTIAGTISGKPEFQSIRTIHIDYVKLNAEGRRRIVNGIDFRKDHKGNFRQRVT